MAAYVRDGTLVVPGGADVLLPGDLVYLIGRPEAILQAEDLFSTRREARRVCIVGGGVVGQSLARTILPHGAHVTIIERDPRAAQQLAVNHPDITVVQGDGTDKGILEEIEIETFDLCAAVTQEDEVNLMASLIAKRGGVARTAAMVQRADYTPIYRELGIDIVVSPRAVAADQILKFTRSENLHSLHVLPGGQAEVVELTARGGCNALDKPLRRLQLPKGSLLAAIARRDEVLIPGGDDVVERGDRVILMTTTAARPSVERLFRGRHSD